MGKYRPWYITEKKRFVKVSDISHKEDTKKTLKNPESFTVRIGIVIYK